MAPPAPPALPAWGTWAVIAGLVTASYASRLGQGFSNDDYTFLDKVRDRALGSLLGWDHLLAGWWRPWSRELHFALLDRLTGGSAVAFHAVNLALWLGVVALALRLLRRLAGPRLSVVALAGAVAASSWGVFVVWACCSQDLWMLLFTLVFLDAFVAGRGWLAGSALALALLSKESAAVFVLLGVWVVLVREGRAGLRAGRVGPVALAALAWALVHPALGGRWLLGSRLGLVPVPRGPLAGFDFTWLLAPLNLEAQPDFTAGLPLRAIEGLLWAAGLGGLCWFALGRGPAPGTAERRKLFVIGLGWWAISWLPMFAPFLRWHSYYGWLGLPGLWLALAAPGRSARGWIVAAVALVAFLRPIAAANPMGDWGTEAYQLEAAGRMDRLCKSFRARLPALSPHTRVFVGNLPNGVGFHTGVRESAPLRVWYRDSTVAGGLFSEYVRREPGEPPGADFFFVVLPGERLQPVADGQAVDDSTLAEPWWPAGEEQVSHLFTLAGEHTRALAGFARLAAAYPGDPRHAYHLAMAYDSLGDLQRGAAWASRADSLSRRPGGDRPGNAP